MKLTLDNPASVAAPFGDRFSHVARLDLADGALLILSGQVGVDDNGAVVAPGDAAAQTERIFELISGLLAAHGATLNDVLHVRTFMTSLDDLPEQRRVRDGYFAGPKPRQHHGRSQPLSARRGAGGGGDGGGAARPLIARPLAGPASPPGARRRQSHSRPARCQPGQTRGS